MPLRMVKFSVSGATASDTHNPIISKKTKKKAETTAETTKITNKATKPGNSDNKKKPMVVGGYTLSKKVLRESCSKPGT